MCEAGTKLKTIIATPGTPSETEHIRSNVLHDITLQRKAAWIGNREWNG